MNVNTNLSMAIVNIVDLILEDTSLMTMEFVSGVGRRKCANTKYGMIRFHVFANIARRVFVILQKMMKNAEGAECVRIANVVMRMNGQVDVIVVGKRCVMNAHIIGNGTNCGVKNVTKIK